MEKMGSPEQKPFHLIKLHIAVIECVIFPNSYFTRERCIILSRFLKAYRGYFETVSRFLLAFTSSIWLRNCYIWHSSELHSRRNFNSGEREKKNAVILRPFSTIFGV